MPYLLTFWCRMVASTMYLQGGPPALLERYAPDVTKAFITSRVKLVEFTVNEEEEFDLEDSLQDQLEYLQK